MASFEEKYDEDVKKAVFEAQRFVTLATEYLNNGYRHNTAPCSKKAAMKRSSMDLTRALPPLRNPWNYR